MTRYSADYLALMNPTAQTRTLRAILSTMAVGDTLSARYPVDGYRAEPTEERDITFLRPFFEARLAQEMREGTVTVTADDQGYLVEVTVTALLDEGQEG